MPWLDSITEAFSAVSPRALRRLAQSRLTDVVTRELGRSRSRVEALQRQYPTAGPRELAQRLIDQKKSLAGMLGGISGVFGLASVPADLVLMIWLQLGLLVDIATLHKVNLKSERNRQDLLELFSYANGLGPLQRASPKVVAKVAAVLLNRGGLTTLGRAVPLVAAPITAYLNNQHIQHVGDEAVRHYDGFARARAKSSSRKASA